MFKTVQFSVYRKLETRFSFNKGFVPSRINHPQNNLQVQQKKGSLVQGTEVGGGMLPIGEYTTSFWDKKINQLITVTASQERTGL